MSEEVLYSVEDGVGTVTLNRPEARNALTFGMYESLRRICSDASERGEAKVLIITGAGDKAFASGTDISLFRDFRGAEDGLAYEARMEAVFEAIETCEVPVIAAIAGACTGGGAAIAAACDLRIAEAGARFGFPIARTLGNCLSLANLERMAAIMGTGRVMDMILTARLMPAGEALAAGFVSDVMDGHAEMMSRARELAMSVASHAPLTIRATREALRRMRRGERRDDDLIALCYGSEDFREGLEAFLEKRKPVWKGR